MTKTELNLLVYLETRAVDYGGVVDVSKMNAEEMEIANGWKELGILKQWRRVPFDAITRRLETQLVELSDEAWAVAHGERRARAVRMKQSGAAKEKWEMKYR